MDTLSTFCTPLGWCALLSRDDQLRALSFGHRNAEGAIAWLNEELTAAARTSNRKPRLAQRIVAVLEGEPDEFRDVIIDLDHLTPFGRRVINACRRIAWGQTRSYGQLATAAGFPVLPGPLGE